MVYCKKLLDYCKKVDFFAMRPSDRITFRKNQTFSTMTGRITSWILIGLYIAAFVNFGNDMIYRNNPQSIFSQIVTPDPANLNLTQMKFFMAFGLQDLRNYSAHYINESIYTVEVLQRYKVDGKITLMTLPIERCSLDSVPDVDDLKDYYARNQINNLYCLRNDDSISPELKSTWDGEFYKNILINFSPCVNTSANENQCKSNEIIKTYLDSSNFAIYFTNEAIDPNNFQKPITSFGKQLYTPISSSTLTYIEMLFGHFNFITDKGLLFEDLDTLVSANYLSNRQVLSFSSNIILQIDIKLDKIKTIYSRKYDKIQNVLANIGGIIKALMILSNLVVLPFIRLHFRLNLANTIFKFKTDNNSNTLIRKIKKDKSTIVLKGNLEDNSKKPSLNIPKSSKNEAESIEDNSKKPSLNIPKSSKNEAESFNSEGKKENDKLYTRSDTKKVKISYLNYFFNCFGSVASKTAKKLLNKGLNQIDEVLDITFIMRKLIEIDLLKILFLNEDQINLFNYLPKPIISINSEINKKNDNVNENYVDNLHEKFSKNLHHSRTKKEKLAADSMQMIMSKNLKSNVDQKLLNLLNFTKEHRKNSTIINKSPIFKMNEQNNKELQSNIKLNMSEVGIKSIILFNDDDDDNISEKK